MIKIKALAIFVAALLLATAIPVLSQETVAADLPLLISPNPMAENKTEENQTEKEVSFSDIPDDAAYKEAVKKLVQNGVLNGYPDGTFKPAGNLTRAEMCKMINLTFGYTDIQGVESFPDLVDGEWYVPYVLAARKAGYIQGDAIGTFRPNDMISRQEVCAILYRVIKPYDLPFEITINDKVDDWAKEYVQAIVKNALMPLEEGGLFRATEPIKRHELASAVAPHSSIKVEEIKCKLTLINGEEVLEAFPVIGKTLETFPIPTVIPEGFTFAGWSIVENEDQTLDNEYVFFYDMTLYAYFTKTEYEVEFVAEFGGKSSVVSTQKVKHGEKAELPKAPEVEGYTFGGWTIKGTSEIVDVNNYAITSDVIFVASFTKGAGDAGGAPVGGGAGGGPVGGGSTGGDSTGGGSTGGDTTGGDTTGGDSTGGDSTGGDSTGGDSTGGDSTGGDSTGGDSTGGDSTGGDSTGGDSTGGDSTGGDSTGGDSTGGDSTGGDSTGGDSEDEGETPEITVYYKVKFISNGKTVDTQDVKAGECASSPEDPEKDGYTFVGWSTKENGNTVEVEEYEINKEITFYAVFELDKQNPNDPATLEALKKAITQFSNMRLTNTNQKEIRRIVVSTIEYVLVDAENGEYIDSDYVRDHYEDALLDVEDLLNDKATDRDKFISAVKNAVDKDTFKLLADFFLSEELKNKYL